MTTSICLLLLPGRNCHPNRLPLEPSRQEHEPYKDEKQWSQESKQSNKPGPIEPFHRSFKSLGNDIHTRYHHECQEESKDQPKYNRPAQWSPEHHTISPKENIG